MSENYSLKELNEWADKVIDCISKWADEMNKAFNGTPTSIKIEKLDFSEHDKVFEDKIAKLKKDYKTASELLGKYQQENESLKKRIIELEDFSCQAEQETESLVEKLNQRIAELESENEKLFDYLNGITGNTKAEIKNNIKNIEKIDKKPTKRTGVIIAREIDGQTYVLLDDFMSAVNDLQAKIGT